MCNSKRFVVDEKREGGRGLRVFILENFPTSKKIVITVKYKMLAFFE